MRRDGWVKLKNGEIHKKRYCVEPKWLGFMTSEPELWRIGCDIKRAEKKHIHYLHMHVAQTFSRARPRPTNHTT
ncbi:hypothetical protein HBI24_049350 [Parastagonospora nodorum]|nr:hypothetical protein HBI71_168360 [Parastagonospora nodorum]KAH5589974.1 hypothetical protein HBI24_049350 [Parastagonospora nodorum]